MSLNIKRSMRTTTAPLTYVDIIDLSSSGTANCYIVSNAGKYKFNASVKGNSTESIGSALSAEVLWESFGTDVAPSVGDIVRNATYKDGYIEFETPSTLAEGNAVIAAKDASGKILWSWHIWVTDQPEEHTYPNNAGIMMDRNLGATSTLLGDICALGLFYQWGRKDPFLGSSNISDNVKAMSTCSWPSAVESSSSKGTIEYITANPMTFISTSYSSDWHFNVSQTSSGNYQRFWTANKSIYDPCPVGYKVPEGGDSGFWAMADFEKYSTYDNVNLGISYSILSPTMTTTWFPRAGLLYRDGDIAKVGQLGEYWSSTYSNAAGSIVYLYFSDDYLYQNSGERVEGRSIRCIRE